MKSTIAVFLLFIALSGCREQSNKIPMERFSAESAGFSAEKLLELASFLDSADTSSMILAYDGKIFFEWGEINKKHAIHSIRKPLINAL